MSNKELHKIEEAIPSLRGNEYIADLSQVFSDKKDLRILAESDGGKILFKTIRERIDLILSNLRRDYKTATRDELVAVISAYDAQMALLDEIEGIRDQEDALRNELDEAILENSPNVQDD